MTSVHSWLIRSGDLTILLDTCGGNHKDRPWTRRFHQLDTPYLQRLRAAGAAPEDIDMVLCTHLHADHVGWNTMLRDGRWVPTFPNAKYLFSRRTTPIGTCGKIRRWQAIRVTRPTRTAFCRLWNPARPCWSTTATTSPSKLSVEAAPGHSPGHVLFKLVDEGRQAVFCGDVIHHALQVYAPHWTHMADERPG